MTAPGAAPNASTVASLAASLGAEAVRSSAGAMRGAVRDLARAGHPVWVGPFEELVLALHEVGRVDLCLGRLVEGHADALRILDQAGVPAAPGVYGVWASRSAGTGVHATRADGRWRLSGESRFSSGVDIVDRVLLPGWLEDGEHLLFDLAADDPGVVADLTTWGTPAMEAARSFTTRVEVTLAGDAVVGPPGFYLHRRGFPIGGLGVAAVWTGGAQAVLEQVVEGLRRFRASAHQLRRLGVMEQALWTAGTVVAHTAARLPDLDEHEVGSQTAAARTTVVTACEQVLDEATRIVGPAGLSGNARLARTLADLTIYLRQHHLDLTLEASGSRCLAERQGSG